MYLSKWHYRFLSLAEHIAAWSKDPSTKCGAVIAKNNRQLSMGYNGFPIGVHDTAEHLSDRNKKYPKVIHAEENAIIFAKQDLTGCTIYTWPFPPCARCAGKIIQTGITKVIAPKASAELLSRWGAEQELAEEMYLQAGVELITINVGEPRHHEQP